MWRLASVTRFVQIQEQAKRPRAARTGPNVDAGDDRREQAIRGIGPGRNLVAYSGLPPYRGTRL
jgi:hypothetical protein